MLTIVIGASSIGVLTISALLAADLVWHWVCDRIEDAVAPYPCPHCKGLMQPNGYGICDRCLEDFA